MTPIPTSDLFLSLVLLAGMVLLLTFAEQVYRRFPERAETLRKFIHLATGVAVLPAPLLFSSLTPIFLITILFAILNFWSIRRGKLKSIHEVSRASWGTFYYPLSYAVLLLLFWGRNTMLLSIPFALMAFGDAAAGMVAQQIPDRKILPMPGDKKSWEGSAAMFVISAIIVAAGLALFQSSHNLSWPNILLVSIAIGLIAAVAEALSYRGSDNLTVPLLTALGLYVILQPSTQNQFLFGEMLALTVVVIAFLVHALDLSGALMGFLVGTIVFGLGGWLFAIPMLLFFIISSLLSKLPQRNAKFAQEIIAKGGRRDATQVLANGLLPTLMVMASLFTQKETAFLLYLGGLAAATADTWATEIGLRLGKNPRSILNGKPVVPGTSGGITMAGTLGAMLGAALVTLAGAWSSQLFTGRSIPVLGVALAGIVANFIDSLLGATVQRRNRCGVCGKITERDEHCERQTIYASGWRWLNNDGVNLACGLSGIVCSSAFRHWF